MNSTSPPPRMIFTPGNSFLINPIMAKAVSAWLRKFRERPTIPVVARSSISGSRLLKYG